MPGRPNPRSGPETKKASVTIEGVPRVEDREALELVDGKRHGAEGLGQGPDQLDQPARRAVGLYGLYSHGVAEEWARENLRFQRPASANHDRGMNYRRFARVTARRVVRLGQAHITRPSAAGSSLSARTRLALAGCGSIRSAGRTA